MHIVQDRAEECDEFHYRSTQHEKEKGKKKIEGQTMLIKT
jgi:hypothetical protein